MADLRVDIYNGSSWTKDVQVITSTPQSASSEAYTESTVDLSSYAGQTIRVRFRAISKGFSIPADMAIDDVYIENNEKTFNPASGNSGNYHDASNWSPNGIPGTNTIVTINSGDTCNVNSTISESWNALAVNGVLDMNGNAVPSITNTISGSGSIVTNNTGSSALPSGKTWGPSVEYGASTTQIVTGTYTNLSITGSGTRTLGGNVTVNSQADSGFQCYTGRKR